MTAIPAISLALIPLSIDVLDLAVPDDERTLVEVAGSMVLAADGMVYVVISSVWPLTDTTVTLCVTTLRKVSG